MAAETTMRLGANIKKRRDVLGLTQQQLAERMGPPVDKSRISEWERGEHRPSPRNMDKLVPALELEDASSLHEVPAPDLMGTLNGVTDSERLERLELGVAEILAHLKKRPLSDFFPRPDFPDGRQEPPAPPEDQTQDGDDDEEGQASR